MTGVAVIILTRDEALHIERALASVAPFASQVFVIDSGSTDGTVGLAEAHGATVLHHPWSNYARQFQWALDHAPITSDWVMRLDADEVVEADLAHEILDRLPNFAGSGHRPDHPAKAHLHAALDPSWRPLSGDPAAPMATGNGADRSTLDG